MIHWKPSIESCGKKSYAKKDTDARQCMQANDAQDLLIGKDHQYINTRLIIDDKRTIRKSENVQDLSRVTAPSPTRVQDPDRETVQCEEDQRAVPTVHGKKKLLNAKHEKLVISNLDSNQIKIFSVIVERKMFRIKIGETNDIEVLLGSLQILFHQRFILTLTFIYRRGNHHMSRSSRSNFKSDTSYKQSLRDPHENHQFHDTIGSQ